MFLHLTWNWPKIYVVFFLRKLRDLLMLRLRPYLTRVRAPARSRLSGLDLRVDK